MKILAVGDIHGDGKLAEKLAIEAERNKVDLVLLTGDLTLSDNFDKGMIESFVKRKQKVVFVPGNHESPLTTDILSQTYGIKNLEGYGMKLTNDIGLFGCGAVNIGIHAIDESEIFDLLKKGHSYVKDAKTKIMVTHVHPLDSLSDKLSLLEGSEAVLKAIKELKPDILLCSHSHEAKGIEEKIESTKVINVSKEAKILEF